MKAWQFTKTHEPLVLNEVPDPVAGPGQVVVDVKAAGLCHTDVGVLEDEGWMSSLATTPIALGHEVAGQISQVGEGVTGWSVGDRVGICPTVLGAPGFATNGGFGEKVLANAAALVAIPDEVSWALGAAATDAGMTSHAAVITNGQVKAGDKVGIIGYGGLGQIGARVAVLAGADVYVAEINEATWDSARAAGATGVAASISELGADFDVIIDYAGFGTTTAAAIEHVRLGGRVVQVGMGRLEATISTKWLILKSVTLVGSQGGTIEDVRGCYDFFATGQIDPAITEISFDEIPAGLEKLSKGEVVGRLVAVYP